MTGRSAFIAATLVILGADILGQQKANDGATARLTLHGWKSALELSIPGLLVIENRTTPDGLARKLVAGNGKGTNLSVQLGPGPYQDAISMRDAAARNLRQQATPEKSDFKFSEYNGTPMLEYMIEKFQGQPVRMKHFNAYRVKDGIVVDIHFSKVRFRPGEETQFYSILDSVRLTESSGKLSSFEYFQQGSYYYLQSDHQNAIKHFREALELEKTEPTLDRRTLWRVLVDNLGMSYGISGDYQKAKETFEYGLAQDPTYPMFHYNMACTYAEMNDLGGAIAYLKSTFAHKKNMIAGEKMPDPAKDSSFARFLNNETFKQALRTLK